jgi:4'-phosphopantetheinyl transferase
LEDADIAVWEIDLLAIPSEVEAYRALLSRDEIGRAERFRFDRDERRFIVARAGLRLLLGQQLGIPANQLRFAYGPFGKPVLARPTSPKLHFNLSHADERALVAVSARYPVGTDIERIRDIPDLMSVVRGVFRPNEIDHLQRQSGDQRKREFFRIWTAKEAVLKATGQGLSGTPLAIDVSLCDDRRPQSYRIDRYGHRYCSLLRLSPGGSDMAHIAYLTACQG